MEINEILNKIQQIEHGFQHIIDGANEILSAYSKEQCFEFALDFLKQEAYQDRMLATMILGRLATTNSEALCLLKEQVSTMRIGVYKKCLQRLLMRSANIEDTKLPYHLLKNG